MTGTKMAILLRIVPYIPWNVFNYIAGVTGMRFYSYLIGSIGSWPWIVICSFIGSGLKSLDEAASGTSGGDDGVTNTIVLVVGEKNKETRAIKKKLLTLHAKK